MATFLASLEPHHHNTDHAFLRRVVDIQDGADERLYTAVHLGLEALLPGAEVEDLGVVQAVKNALDEATATGQDVRFAVEADGELEQLEIWHKPDGNGTNFGMGDGTRSGTVFLSVVPYVPDAAMAERLRLLSREELEAILLRAYAENGLLSFPG